MVIIRSDAATCNDKVRFFGTDDIATWTVCDVRAFVNARAQSPDCSVGLANRITDVSVFLGAHAVDGHKLAWLVSTPFEAPPMSSVPCVAGKLKNLNPVLWKGVRWKDFLGPIIDLYSAPRGARIEVRPGGAMVLVAATGHVVPERVPDLRSRVYTMAIYGD